MKDHLLELRKLYDEERWSDCFSLLYKHDAQTKSLVWILITLSYCLNVLFFYLIWHVFDPPTTGTTLIAVVIAAVAGAAALIGTIAAVAGAGTGTIAAAAVAVAGAAAAAVALTGTATAAFAVAFAIATLAVTATEGIDEYLIKKWCQKRTKETEDKKMMEITEAKKQVEQMNKKEKNKLFTITQHIAESDSIGEGYPYHPNYTQKDFKQDINDLTISTRENKKIYDSEGYLESSIILYNKLFLKEVKNE